MPKTLTDSWRAELGNEGVERHLELLNRYGNLTLFYYGYNIPASNKSFEEKRAYYADSDVILTQELVEHDRWDIESIQQRQERLAALADEIWSIPETKPQAERPTLDALAGFKTQLGALWPSVEAYCVEVPASVVETWSTDLTQHLRGHLEHAPKALLLAQRLQMLSARWEYLDSHERTVLAGAVAYFLATDDYAPDEASDGLDDDEQVVAAAEQVLALG